jgi:hypothetical protein
MVSSSDAQRPATSSSSNQPPRDSQSDPVLCQHCGRTATNGISCEGACVADSGY